MRNPIIIVGFMGSGKTSVARELARQLNVRFVDLDEFIAEQESRSPEQIITNDGEPHFRIIETAALEKVLSSDEPGVIAAGGGAWTIGTNRRLIAQHGATTVWLNCPFEMCWKRIQSADYLRPMAPSREAAEELYATRSHIYELADIHIDIVEVDTPQQIAQKITAVLKENSNS